MKSSKVFLSVTTCLLAVAAFAAGKAGFNGKTVTVGCTANDFAQVNNIACFTVGTGVRTHTGLCKTQDGSTLVTCSATHNLIYSLSE